jgi:hypothetical protein
MEEASVLDGNASSPQSARLPPAWSVRRDNGLADSRLEHSRLESRRVDFQKRSRGAPARKTQPPKGSIYCQHFAPLRETRGGGRWLAEIVDRSLLPIGARATTLALLGRSECEKNVRPPAARWRRWPRWPVMPWRAAVERCGPQSSQRRFPHPHSNM